MGGCSRLPHGCLLFFKSFFFFLVLMVTLTEVMITFISPLNAQPGYTPKCLTLTMCVMKKKKMLT